MAKDPAVLFYTSDFLSGTYTMTDEQVGKYIRLLSLQHQKGRLTEKDMMNICKSYDADVFSKFKIENGEYFNARMELESNKRKKYSESRSKNRTKKDMNNICKTYEKHMENENENRNENINTLKGKMYKSEDFAELPEQYIQSSIERLKIQKNISVNSLQISQMWSIFKSQNLAGDKWYNSEADVYRHFSNWIKNQTFKNETDQRTTKTGRNSGTYELLEKLRSEYGGDFGQV